MDETEARLRRELSRVPEDDLAPGDLADLFSRVAAETVDRPPTLRDRLRELSTPVRIALAVGGALIMVTVALLIVGIRTDLTGQAMARYAVAMAAIAGLMGAAFAASLRGAHQRPLRWWTWVLVVTALLVPLALAVMPWLWEGDGVIRPSGHAHPFGMCGVMGLVTGALTAERHLAARRGGRGRWAHGVRDAAASLPVRGRDAPAHRPQQRRAHARRGGRGGDALAPTPLSRRRAAMHTAIET